MAAVFIEPVGQINGQDVDKDILTFDLDKVATQRIQDLEHELQLTRENLQATIEELETSNEELLATNEELLASNEELQSTNQELQSVNEELHTVNTEHQRKNMELVESNNDFHNLMNGTDAGALFVDENLEIRKFSPRAAKIFDIDDSRIGQPIARLAHRLQDIDPAGLVALVQESRRQVEKEVRTLDERWYLMRIVPYRIGSEAYSGVIMTFRNIHERKRTQLLLEESEARFQFLAENVQNVFCMRTPDTNELKFRSIFEQAPVGIALIDMKGNLLESNSKLVQMLGYRPDELKKRPLVEFSDPPDRDAELALFKEMAAGERDFFRLRKRFVCQNGEPLNVTLTAMLIRNADGKPGYAIALLEKAHDPI
jgi:two-component system CheB/CheR fusion protein